MVMATLPRPQAPMSGGALVLSALRVSWWVWLFAAALVGALVAHSVVVLDYVHILCAVLWTGTDLFMGFVVGPILRRLDPIARREFIGHLMPRMLFYMPVVAAVTTTAGWFLAHWVGVYENPSLRPWFVGALALSLLMFGQGLGLLLPLNLRVFWELQKEKPDMDKIRRAMLRYMRLTAWQGLCQLGIIFVMVHFVV
jgi:hypothetical protein